MKYRRTVIGMVATASLAGTAGIAHATHHPERQEYSPCRPADTDGELRAGYSDDGEQGDPRHELPTIYANGNQDDMSGYIGVCGGGSQDQPVQYVQVSGGVNEQPEVTHSDPPAPLP